MMRNRKIKILAIIIIAILILAIFNLEHVARYANIIKARLSKFDVDYVQKIVDSFGALGVLVYILINCIRPLLFIPTTVMYVSGGVIYGRFKGSIYTLIGLVGGTSIPFFLARRFKNVFRRIIGDKYLAKINIKDDDNIVRKLFTIRVTPALPFDIVSYIAGMSDVPYKEFLLGSLLGAFPKIILYSFLGNQIDNIFSIQTAIIFIILLTLAISPHVFHKKLQISDK